MTKRLIFLILAFLFVQPLAAADWLRAESENYIVHAKLDESEMRELVELMEDFDRLLQGQVPPQTERGRKLEVYADEKYTRISRVSTFSNIGFSRSWPEFAGAFVQFDPADNKALRNHALFWALSGNYVDNAFFRPQPLWAQTGIRLFYSTSYRDDEGNFILGAPDVRRPMKGTMTVDKLQLLLSTEEVPTTPAAWSQIYNYSREAAYPLLIEPEYSGVLEQYLDAYASGQSMEDAGIVLGDLDELASSIRERMSSRQRTFRSVTLPPREPLAIVIRPMTDAEIALVEPRFLRMRSSEIAEAAKKLRRLTERYPESPLTWYEFAAAEFDRVRSAQLGGEPVFRGFGFSNGELVVSANPYSDIDAWRAVNRSLELDPDFNAAIRLKAEIMLARLVKAGEIGAADEYDNVRTMLAPLASDPERQPLAAALYFQSFIEQGEEPTDEALDLLGRAFVANPGVDEFRYAYAVALTRRGQRDVAENLLRSMLNNPEYRDAARRALDEETL